MQAPQTQAPVQVPTGVSREQARLLFIRARAIFEHAYSEEKLQEGRGYLEQAAALGNDEAIVAVAYSCLTGERRFERDLLRALQLLGSRSSVCNKISSQDPRAILDYLITHDQKFAMLWRCCTVALSSDACLHSMHRQITGYRIYQHLSGPHADKEILVLEFEDGSEAEFTNEYDVIYATSRCSIGGHHEVDGYMPNLWSSIMSARASTEGRASVLVARAPITSPV